VVGILRERLQRKAHSAVIRARTCSGKRDGESSSRHAPTTTMLHYVHQFRNTFPLVMIDCKRSSVLRCIAFQEGLALQVVVGAIIGSLWPSRVASTWP
jgi:hypothetical protein